MNDRLNQNKKGKKEGNFCILVSPHFILSVEPSFTLKAGILISLSDLKYMGELGCHFEVYRNDELTVEELQR